MHDLCLHPEYVQPLRTELEGPQWAAFEKTGNGLPLLDSFIKESARTTPVESSKLPSRTFLVYCARCSFYSLVSTRRQALKPFVLSNGCRVEVGEWVCTPARAMMRDPSNYVKPLEFHGFRFVDPKILETLDVSHFQVPQPGQSSQLTDVVGWQIWGSGRMVW